MGIPLTISGYHYDEDLRKSVLYKFPVILITTHEVEFPEFDIDAQLALRELGFGVSSPEISFNGTYKVTGLNGLMEKMTQEIYESLEHHGYKSFEHGDFSKKQFVWALLQHTRTSKAQVNYKIDLLKSFVDFSEKDDGELSQEDFIDAVTTALVGGSGHLEDYLDILRPYIDFSEEDDGRVSQEAYIQALLQALSSEAVQGGTDIEELLDELMRLVDEDDVDYDISSPHTHQDDEWYDNTETTEYEITIYGESIIKWSAILQSRIYDPISFTSSVTDYCEANDEFCIPDGASSILSYFDYDEHQPDDPDDPDHPEADEDGDYAVLYEQHDTTWVLGKGTIVGDVIEEIVVPYDDERTAAEAIESSKSILSRDGEEETWSMRIIERKSPEELQEIAFLKKQIPLGGWGEHVPHPIWDEWREMDEE